MALSYLFEGGMDYQLIIIRSLQIILHLPILTVNFPANVMMIKVELIPYVMFDFLENPYGYDISTLIYINTDEDSEVAG